MKRKKGSVTKLYNNINQIRQIKSKEAILQTINDCLDDTFDTSVRDFSVVESLAEKFFRYGHVASIKCDAGTMGYIAFYCNNTIEKEGYISMIVVKKAYQKQGVGSMLLQYALEECSKNNMTAVRLEVAKNNTKAMEFYAKKGFVLKSAGQGATQYLYKNVVSRY